MTVLKTSLRSFLSHRARMLLSGVAIMLSVAFVTGTLVFSDTLNTTFDRFFSSISADVTVSPAEEETQDTGRDATLPASLVERVGDVDGVAAADGVVLNDEITIVDEAGDTVGGAAGAPVIGTGWGPAAWQTLELAEGEAPAGPGEALVDQDTAASSGLAVGDTLALVTVSGRETVEVTGIAAFQGTNPGVAYLLLDPAAARSTLLGSPGLVSEVHVTAAEGVSDTELARRLTAAGLDGADGAAGTALDIRTREESAQSMNEDVEGFLGVIRYAMLGFAGIAVLVGVFLIVNTFSMLVAQRTREIGLLRAVGASRRQTMRAVLAEALLLGVLGAALGVAAGVGLARGLMTLMESTGINLDTSQLTVNPATPVTGLVVGIVTTLAAAWLPARRAGRVSPMAALRDAALAGSPPGEARPGLLRACLGLLLTGAGAAALVAGAGAAESADGAPLLAGGVLLTLAGAIVLGPLLATVVVRMLSTVVLRGFGTAGRMAGRNALRNPRRTGATAGALMIGLALVGSLSVVASSVVASATDQLDRAVGADFVVEPDSGVITPEAAEAIRGIPGTAHVTDYTGVNVTLTTPDGRSSEEEVIAADPSYARDLRTPTLEGELAAAYRPGQMSVGESFAEEHGLSVGDELTVRFAGGTAATLTLGAVTSEDTLFDQGAMYMNIATAAAHLPADAMPLNAAMFLQAEPGQQDAVEAALQAALTEFPQLAVDDQESYRELLEEEISGMLNMVYGLLALAIIVAVLGVINTLALSVVERTREIGLLRAIGLSRRQLRRTIRLESVVIALFGALLGLGLGLAWGAAAQQVLAASGFNVLEIPWVTIATVFAGSAAVGLIAALVPAFRAGRMNVLTAIATE